MRNKLVRDSFVRLAGRTGLHLAARTPRADVLSLIHALRPVESGGDLIRLGPDGDGGYLVPDDLDGIGYAFSPGVANQSGFEAALAARGMHVFMADRSVEGPAESNAAFTFDKKFVGCVTDEAHVTLDDWKREKLPGYTGDLLLQMDIEGAEYETLFAAPPALLAQFRVMVIEFHDLHNLWNRPFFELAHGIFRKLLAAHAVVHVHPNNCCGSVKSLGLEIPRVLEITLQRRDRLHGSSFRTTFPHPLDRDNTRRGDLPLPACWYGPD